MKALLSTLVFISSLAAQAETLKVQCVIQEIVDAQSTSTELTLESSADPHGTIQYPKLTKVPELQPMVALVDNGIVVMSLYHEATGIATASQSDVGSGKGARLQMLLPQNRGVMMECVRKTEPTSK